MSPPKKKDPESTKKYFLTADGTELNNKTLLMLVGIIATVIPQISQAISGPMSSIERLHRESLAVLKDMSGEMRRMNQRTLDKLDSMEKEVNEIKANVRFLQMQNQKK